MAAADEKYRLSTMEKTYYGVQFPSPNDRVALWACDGIGGVTVYPSMRAAKKAVGVSNISPSDARGARKFVFIRHFDVHNTSGDGIVAVGVEWPDETCAVGWLSEPNSVQTFDSTEDIVEIHGHQGDTALSFSTGWDEA